MGEPEPSTVIANHCVAEPCNTSRNARCLNPGAPVSLVNSCGSALLLRLRAGSERDTAYARRPQGWQAVNADGCVWPEFA
jgi:hypothetical protein